MRRAQRYRLLLPVAPDYEAVGCFDDPPVLHALVPLLAFE